MIETFLIIFFLIAFVIFLLIPGSGLLMIALFAGRKSKAGRSRRTGRAYVYNEGLARMEERIKNIETIMTD